MNEIQSKITCLTEKLMADYGKGRVIDEIKMFAYPDGNIIIDILEKLKIVIGKNVVIGGNAFITSSIPEGARVSVKSHELTYNYDSKHPVERKDIELDETWFYMI